MQIQYDEDEIGINSNDQTIYFTLTDDEAHNYDWVADIPLDVPDIQVFLDQNTESYLLDILRKTYPGGVSGRDYEPAEGATELEAYQAWIAEGAPIKDDEGNVIGNVEEVDFPDPSKPEPVNRKAIKQQYKDANGIGTLEERIINLEAVVFGADS